MAYEKSKGMVSVATGYSKSGGYKFTKIDNFIEKENLNIAPAQVQDLDSYVNANGKLKRNVLKHTRGKVDFSTPYMKYEKKSKFVGILRKGMNLDDGECNQNERKLYLRVFNDLTEEYDEGHYYLDPSLTFNPAGTYEGVPCYLPTSVALVEY